jgi:2-oxoglutarate ferredoxin oxidoreductase subunit beta
MTSTNISTNVKPTWCPGCFNFQILAGFRNFIEKELENGKKKSDFAIVTGIGCHGKIFDYVNLNGINALHGRSLPTAFGIKVGNPNLNVYCFAGDGDAYSEGIEHLIHAPRYNIDITYLVHNNQIFALTVGQPTPTTELNYVDKTNPEGNKNKPINPIKLMLSAGASFIARVFADAEQIKWVLEEAKKHRGFKFIEILQPCLIFHPDSKYKNKIYWLCDDKKYENSNIQQAMKKAEEFDYSEVKSKTKIPLGIFYKKKEKIFEEKYWQLQNLIKTKKSCKEIRR